MTAIIDMTALKLDWESGICLRPLASKYGISPATAKTYLNKNGIDTTKKCFTKEIWDLIQKANKVLDEYESKMTVRQVYYQMASRQYVPLSKKGYDLVVSVLNKGRKYGYVSWDKIEDRTRQPKSNPAWVNVSDFMETVRTAYHKDIWKSQPGYFEVWLEKNALFGLVMPVTSSYGVTLQTITGYSSISTIYEASKRLKDGDTILYLGDHDATGIDIDRSLRDSFLEDHNLNINVERIGLLYEDIEKYQLLPNPIKESDPRAKNYLFEKQAELDALPPDILRMRVQIAIESHLDMTAYYECKGIEQEELNSIQTRFTDVQPGMV